MIPNEDKAPWCCLYFLRMCWKIDKKHDQCLQVEEEMAPEGLQDGHWVLTQWAPSLVSYSRLLGYKANQCVRTYILHSSRNRLLILDPPSLLLCHRSKASTPVTTDQEILATKVHLQIVIMHVCDDFGALCLLVQLGFLHDKEKLLSYTCVHLWFPKLLFQNYRRLTWLRSVQSWHIQGPYIHYMQSQLWWGQNYMILWVCKIMNKRKCKRCILCPNNSIGIGLNLICSN